MAANFTKEQTPKLERPAQQVHVFEASTSEEQKDEVDAGSEPATKQLDEPLGDVKLIDDRTLDAHDLPGGRAMVSVVAGDTIDQRQAGCRFARDNQMNILDCSK